MAKCISPTRKTVNNKENGPKNVKYEVKMWKGAHESKNQEKNIDLQIKNFPLKRVWQRA